MVIASGTTKLALDGGNHGWKVARHHIDVAAEQIVECLRRTAIRHMDHIDAGDFLEQLHRQMKLAADAG